MYRLDLLDFGIGLLPFYYTYYVDRQIKVELSFGNTKGGRFSIQSVLVVCRLHLNSDTIGIRILWQNYYCKNFSDMVGLELTRERESVRRTTLEERIPLLSMECLSSS